MFMVFEYMEYDLTGILDTPEIHFTQDHIKSWSTQLLRRSSSLASASTTTTDTDECYDILNKKRGLDTYEPSKFENEIYRWWETSGCFEPDAKQKEAKGGKKPYVLPMPPPNVTGRLHMGHAIFVALQDVLARFHRMRGRPVLWLPGVFGRVACVLDLIQYFSLFHPILLSFAFICWSMVVVLDAHLEKLFIYINHSCSQGRIMQGLLRNSRSKNSCLLKALVGKKLGEKSFSAECGYTKKNKEVILHASYDHLVRRLTGVESASQWTVISAKLFPKLSFGSMKKDWSTEENTWLIGLLC